MFKGQATDIALPRLKVLCLPKFSHFNGKKPEILPETEQKYSTFYQKLKTGCEITTGALCLLLCLHLGLHLGSASGYKITYAHTIYNINGRFCVKLSLRLQNSDRWRIETSTKIIEYAPEKVFIASVFTSDLRENRQKNKTVLATYNSPTPN